MVGWGLVELGLWVVVGVGFAAGIRMRRLLKKAEGKEAEGCDGDMERVWGEVVALCAIMVARMGV